MPFLTVTGLLTALNPLQNRPVPRPWSENSQSVDNKSRWYADDAAFALSFRPKGHAGDFMHDWLDTSATAPADSTTPLRAIFVSLSDP